MGEVGFEPTKAEPTGLQPVPFGHSGTPPRRPKCSRRGAPRGAAVCETCSGPAAVAARRRDARAPGRPRRPRGAASTRRRGRRRSARQSLRRRWTEAAPVPPEAAGSAPRTFLRAHSLGTEAACGAVEEVAPIPQTSAADPMGPSRLGSHCSGAIGVGSDPVGDGGELVDRSGDREVDQPGRGAEDDIARLDVEVDDPFLFEIVERRGELQPERQQLFRFQGPCFRITRERRGPSRCSRTRCGLGPSSTASKPRTMTGCRRRSTRSASAASPRSECSSSTRFGRTTFTATSASSRSSQARYV